ncbi:MULTISPECIES: hypothetical protein [unclassified Acinetobacter]|uniref:hypothetical protein n=1 Tax=unclassified Acinetobacter TaxID=196816 RepID=UPI0015D27065|nr:MULTISPECIES: hypothetical protein [unclassified Acinetobacter]
MSTSDIILFHQSAQTMKHMGLLLLCYPIGILMTLYLHTPDPPSSFVRGLVFLWQEFPSFYGYMLGFLMLSLLVYSIKLKITSRTIYYTLAGYRISLCLYREAVHYSFINPQYDSLKARTKRWLTRLPAHQINQRDGTLDFILCQPSWRDRLCLRLFRIHLSMFSRQQAKEIIQAMYSAWNLRS